jgi:hypothetical protein
LIICAFVFFCPCLQKKTLSFWPRRLLHKKMLPSTLRGFWPEQVSERLRAAIRAMPYHRTATNVILAALFHTIMSVSCISARAQGRLEAHYGITMTGVPIGHIAWHVDIGNNFYETSAKGKASCVLSVLIKGEGSVATSGIDDATARSGCDWGVCQVLGIE